MSSRLDPFEVGLLCLIWGCAVMAAISFIALGVVWFRERRDRR